MPQPIHEIANTTMVIDSSRLDWHGDSAAPVAVYDGGSPTLAMLGKSEGRVVARKLVFGDCTFELRNLPGSSYLALHALDGHEPVANHASK